MINIPLEKIKEKILEETDISEESLDEKIEEKLDNLSGLISEEGAAHIVANDLGVKLVDTTSGQLKVENIVEGMRDVELAGKVARTYDVNEFDSENGKGKVGSFMLADDTGQIRIVLWNDQASIVKQIDEGDTVQVQSGYVRDNDGRLEIHLNERSALEVNPEGLDVDVSLDDLGPNRKKLVDLEGSDDNVEVMATIVQVFEPRFFEVCPGCGGRARESGDAYECEEHGTVNDPDYSYVMNLFLDDGSDNVRTVLWRSQVQQLLDMDNSEVMKFHEDPMEFESVKTDLLGDIVKIRGRVQENEAFERLELVANSVETDPDPEEEMDNLEEKSETEEKKEKEEQEDTADTEEASEESEEDEGEKVEEEVKTKVEKKEPQVSEEAVEEGLVEEEDLDEVDDEDIPSIDEL